MFTHTDTTPELQNVGGWGAMRKSVATRQARPKDKHAKKHQNSPRHFYSSFVLRTGTGLVDAMRSAELRSMCVIFSVSLSPSSSLPMHIMLFRIVVRPFMRATQNIIAKIFNQKFIIINLATEWHQKWSGRNNIENQILYSSPYTHKTTDCFQFQSLLFSIAVDTRRLGRHPLSPPLWLSGVSSVDAVNFRQQKNVHHRHTACQHTKNCSQNRLFTQNGTKKKDSRVFYLFSCSEHEKFKCLVTYGNFVSIQQKKNSEQARTLIDISIVLQADFLCSGAKIRLLICENAFLWTLNWDFIICWMFFVGRVVVL